MFTRSDPYIRDIVTISLRPSLASHALKVRNTIEREFSESFVRPNIKGISITVFSMMASRASSLSRKCLCREMNTYKEIRKEMNNRNNKEVYIESRD
jgi:hypothetical protein